MAITTADPTSTLTLSGSVSVTGAASAHAALSDSSDASYLDGSDEWVFVGKLDNLVLGSSFLRRVRYQLRAEWAAQDALELTLRVGGAAFVTGSRAFVEIDSASPADYTSGWLTPSITAADLLNMYVRVDSPQAIDLMELAVDYDTVTQPTVALDTITPDPYTASNAVPLSWTPTLDSGGGGQTHYEVKAFDQTTYGAGFPGLDLDADSPFWESGEIASTNNSATSGVLDNSDTYRVAVRIAQTINGVLFWSDWDTDDVTINVPSSEIDTVTAVADNATGSITVTVNRDTSGGNPAWEVLEVEYSQDAGSSWSPVRFATVATPDTANSHDVTHYEAVRDVDTLYRARATLYSSGVPITGAWVQSTAVQWTGKTEFVKVLANPALNVAVDRFVSDPEPRFARRAGELDIIGRADPIVRTDGVRKTPAGRVTFQTETVAQADAVSAALNAASPLLLDVPADLDFDTVRYVHVRDDQVRFNGRRSVSDYRLWTIGYRVIGTPPDDTAGTL